MVLADSGMFLAEARADRFRPRELDWIMIPGFDFGLHEQNLDALLDKSNWLRHRPRIDVRAAWTEDGDILVEWTPRHAADFRSITDRELASFNGIADAVSHAQQENRAALHIVQAHIAWYGEFIRGLRDHLDVVRASRIVPFRSFDIDIEDGPFCCIEKGA